MPGVDYAAMRREVPMAAVLRALGFQPHHARGEQLRGPCPVHGARAGSRSFSVNLRLGRYRCFVCGSHGTHWSCGRQFDV